MGHSCVCCPNGHSIETLICKIIREVAGKLGEFGKAFERLRRTLTNLS